MFTSIRMARWSANHLLGVAITAGLLIATSFRLAIAQEAAPAAAASPEESKYADLRRSKDRLSQQLVDRYFNLIKLQEWSSDKGTKIKAKYVSHDANLKSVKLSVAKGNGAERVMKEITVPVERLNKTCQSRVKQIATLQKKLDELAASAAKDAADPAAADQSPSGVDPGAPMVDERGVEPPGRRPTADSAPAEPEPRAAAPSNTPASPITDDGDPDPLGFGELPANPIPPGATPLLVDPGAPPRPAQANGNQAIGLGPKDKAPWRTDYEVFRASFRVDASGDPPVVDWATLPELKAATDEVKKWEETGSVGADARREIAKKFSAVGGFYWEATLTEADTSTGDWTERLNLPALPAPLSIKFILDPEQNPGDWQSLKPGDRVRFIGRFIEINDGSGLVAAIRFPPKQPAAGAAAPPVTARER